LRLDQPVVGVKSGEPAYERTVERH
jgi:hypothetical protein